MAQSENLDRRLLRITGAGADDLDGDLFLVVCVDSFDNGSERTSAELPLDDI